MPLDLLATPAADLAAAATAWFGPRKGAGLAGAVHAAATQQGVFAPETLGASAATAAAWRELASLALPEVAATVPEDESILVIEDTPEIRLEHPHVRYVATREANTDGAGRVTPSECIRAGMRMAMNRIIFGEIRDAEAAEAFIDVCASGHPGLSTIHGRSAIEAVARLELRIHAAEARRAETIMIDRRSNHALH